MSLHANHPLAALLAAALLLVAIILIRRIRASTRTRLVAIILPLTAAILIALAIAQPHLLLPRGPTHHMVILLDLSASTRASPWRDPAWLRNLAAQRLGPDAHITVVGFAQQPHALLEDAPVDDPQRWPDQWLTRDLDSLGNPAITGIDAALAWRSSAESPGAPPILPRWLITDGLLTIPTDRTPPAKRFAITILPPPVIDVAIRDLILRPRPTTTASMTAPASIELLAQLAATGPTDATLDILRDGTPILHQALSFQSPSTRWITLRDTPPTASVPRYHYEVQIHRQPTPDPWPENDHAAILYTPPGPPHILTITNSPAALASGDALTPDQFLQTPAELSADGIQAIILDNIPAERLTPDDPSPLSAQSAQTLDRFIHQTGAGLLIRGPAHAFGPGHYGQGSAAGDLLEQLSPLTSHPPRDPNLHLILLLDASGSMAEPAPSSGSATKFRFLAETVAQAAASLPADTHLSILTFSGAAQSIIDGPTPLPALSGKLAAIQPTGPTAPDSALDLLTQSIAADSPQTRRALVLLTDGEIPAMDVPRWTALLTAHPTRLIIIAPNPAEASLLRRLATTLPGSLWLPAADPAQWSATVRQAIGRQINGQLISEPLPWTAPTLSLAGTATQWTQAWLKPEATLIASGAPPTMQPLAAIVQRGLGKVAAIAMTDGNGGGRLTDELLHQITAAPGDRRFSLAAKRDVGGGGGGGWLLTADGLDNATFLDHQPLFARILSADGESVTPLPQTAPGHYETHFTPTGPFTAIIFRQAPSTDEQLIGRLQPPDVQTSEYPASVDPPPLPSNLTTLPATLTDPTRWSPSPAATDLALTIPLYVAAALATLLALHLRRRA